MISRAILSGLGVAMLLGVAAAQAPPSQYVGSAGCLSNGSCNSVIKNKPNDAWHNYICIDCHVAPITRPAPSDVERVLLASPARFMPIHDQMAPVAKQLYPGTLKPERELSAEARRLIAEMRVRAGQTRTLTVTVRTVGGAALPANVCVGDATNVARYGRQLASATGQAAYRLMPGVPVRITVSLARFAGTTRSLTTTASDAGVAVTMAPGTGGPVC